jgi:hypothetical protein
VKEKTAKDEGVKESYFSLDVSLQAVSMLFQYLWGHFEVTGFTDA